MIRDRTQLDWFDKRLGNHYYASRCELLNIAMN